MTSIILPYLRLLNHHLPTSRLKAVWGDDADQWRPERFLEGVEKNQKTGLGVIANVYENLALSLSPTNFQTAQHLVAVLEVVSGECRAMSFIRKPDPFYQMAFCVRQATMSVILDS